MRHCSSCQNLGIDIEVLNYCGVVLDKCYEFGFYVTIPFLSGFRCPKYRKINKNFRWHMPEKGGK